MSHELPATEGYLSFAGYRTWYRVTGESEEPGKFPLLCLHGGPGATWHHMEPYAELAAEGRRVVCYDQLGCGNSAISEPHDTSMWTTELFLAEVAAVRKELGLDRCHVLGHSWGGMLGMAYAITRPAGLVSLLVESSPASVPFWLTELARLRAELPPEVYFTMNGPSEFHVVGALKDFDVTADLGAIEAPTLLFCGEFDEVTPATVAQAHERIGGSQFVVLPGCSHMGQAERPDLTLGMVRGWLAGVEASPRA